MMLHRVRFLKALVILLTLVVLLVGASYAQEPGPHRGAPSRAVIDLQSGVDVLSVATDTATPTFTPTPTSSPTATKTPEPDDDDDDEEHEFYGCVGQMPEDGFIGTWVVGGVSFVVTNDTEVEEDDCPLQVHAYVKV